MKKVIFNPLNLFSSLLLICHTTSFAQDFTWKKGTTLTGQLGFYGTMGMTSPTLTPGGRQGAISWKDAGGNLWLFGGEGFDHISNFGLLNDLWKYNPANNQWTWINGDNYINNIGVYGALGVSSPSNKPGSRSNSISWTDASGNFWMFGGFGFGNSSTLGYLNDLWKYNVTTNEWTWIGGSNTCFQPGDYGTQGVPSPTNIPGARKGSVSWADAGGNLWMFGGFGNTTSSVTIGSLNDLWKYNISNNEWAWMRGSNLVDQNGTYGTQGTSAPANDPGGRISTTGWKDASGNLWLFGGDGWDVSSTTGTGLLSDLWKYNITANEWTWIKGSNIFNQNGTYGFQGTANPADMPGGRLGATSWIDAASNMWLFGGEGYPGTGSATGGLNDLWKYNAATNEWTWTRGSSVIDQQGSYGSQGVAAFTNIPGARSVPVNWIDASNNLWFFGGYGRPASGSSGSLNDLWKYTNCFISPITMTITSKDSVICAGESTSLTVSGSNNYLWSDNQSTTTSYLVISPSANTTYTVYTSDNNGCKYTAVFTETVEACAGLYSSAGNTALQHVIYPNPNNGAFRIRMPDAEHEAEFAVFDARGKKVFVQQLSSADMLVKPNLDRGLYYYCLSFPERKPGYGKLLIE